MRRPRREMVIDGERKTLHQWSQDPRCEVGYKRLRRRHREGLYRIRGDEVDESILVAPQRPPPKPLKPRKLYEYDKDAKTLAAWARDPRCQVARSTLIHRLGKGWDFGRALLTPPAQPPQDR